MEIAGKIKQTKKHPPCMQPQHFVVLAAYKKDKFVVRAAYMDRLYLLLYTTRRVANHIIFVRVCP